VKLQIAKYTELLIHANIYLSICYRTFLHRLNYCIKVSVNMDHTGTNNNFANNTFCSTL